MSDVASISQSCVTKIKNLNASFCQNFVLFCFVYKKKRCILRNKCFLKMLHILGDFMNKVENKKKKILFYQLS